MFNVKYILHLPIFLLLFISCKKDNLKEYHNLSSISAFNAVPFSKGFDLYLDYSRLNSYTENFDFGSFMKYRSIFPGNRMVTLVTPQNSISQPLFLKQLSFDQNKFYTLLITGQSKIDYLLIEDEIRAPKKGKIYLRFIHLSENAPLLSMKINDVSIPEFNNANYKKVSKFVEFDAGLTYASIVSDNQYVSTMSFENNFLDQGIYTIFMAGLLDAKEKNGKLTYFIKKY